MWDHLSFVIKRLRERIWSKPLTETLPKIMASSMWMMATFAVASMVAAYASASSSATPLSFPLILGDDISQNALSVFTGAFIYSVVALVALMNGLYGGKASQLILFSLTMVVLVRRSAPGTMRCRRTCASGSRAATPASAASLW